MKKELKVECKGLEERLKDFIFSIDSQARQEAAQDQWEKEKYSNFRGAKKVEVLRIEVNEGGGVTGDPVYQEVYYVTLDGKFIGKETIHPLRKFAAGE